MRLVTSREVYRHESPTRRQAAASSLKVYGVAPCGRGMRVSRMGHESSVPGERGMVVFREDLL